MKKLRFSKWRSLMWPKTVTGATQPDQLIFSDIVKKLWRLLIYMKLYVLKFRKIQILLLKWLASEYPLISEKKFVLNAMHNKSISKSMVHLKFKTQWHVWRTTPEKMKFIKWSAQELWADPCRHNTKNTPKS